MPFGTSSTGMRGSRPIAEPPSANEFLRRAVLRLWVGNATELVQILAMAKKKTGVGASAKGDLLNTLRSRFEANAHRHRGLAWDKVATRLDAAALEKLHAMEASGGEPDVVLVEGPKVITFVDCAAESPAGRRSFCYDREAWQARKEARPSNNVVDVASSMGVELLTEDEYRVLQHAEAFDTKTSSWVSTPDAIRALGGALFCDRRYDHVFVYHNGAQSYYAARGFRAKVRL